MTGSAARPTAAVLLTGNELLRGVISDLNASHLARSLELHGFAVERSLTVGDGVEAIEQGLGELVDAHDLVVTSGGLGPTHDDRTVEAIARLAGVELVVNQDVLDKVTRWTVEVSERNGFDPERFAAGNLKQAHVPRGSDVLGLAGTAPGLVLDVRGAAVVVLPGVPSELRRLWELAPEHPRLAPLFARARPRARLLLRTYGIGESHVADVFADLGGDPPGVETSICARRFEVEIDIRSTPAPSRRGPSSPLRCAGSWAMRCSPPGMPRSPSWSPTSCAGVDGRSPRRSRAPAGRSPARSRASRAAPRSSTARS